MYESDPVGLHNISIYYAYKLHSIFGNTSFRFVVNDAVALHSDTVTHILFTI